MCHAIIWAVSVDNAGGEQHQKEENAVGICLGESQERLLGPVTSRHSETSQLPFVGEPNTTGTRDWRAGAGSRSERAYSTKKQS